MLLNNVFPLLPPHLKVKFFEATTSLTPGVNGQAFFLLLAAFGAVVLFFIALTKQMISPPSTTMACQQQALSVNSHPKQLMDELDRELQLSWTEQIPNRRYARILPVIGNGTGSFVSEALEETQPMPREDLCKIDFIGCFELPRYQWLMWLNIMGVILTLIGAIGLIVFAALLNPGSIEPNLTVLFTFGAAMLIVGNFCFKACHPLWGRFDFVSELIWIEMSGNYQSAKLDYGNQFTDRIKTEKQVINIESMTLRVWVAQFETVSFGKNSPRWLIGMRGLPDKAKYLAEHLTQFAANQSIIVAPASSADMEKVAALGALNQLGGGQASASLPKAMLQALSGVESVKAAAQSLLTCSNCNIPLEMDVRFCSECGCEVD